MVPSDLLCRGPLAAFATEDLWLLWTPPASVTEHPAMDPRGLHHREPEVFSAVQTTKSTVFADSLPTAFYRFSPQMIPRSQRAEA